MFKEVLYDHHLDQYTRRCACGKFVLESSKEGYGPYLEHLNDALVASMPQAVVDYWNYYEREMG